MTKTSDAERLAKLAPSAKHWWKQATDMRLAGVAAVAVGIAVLAVAGGIWLAETERKSPPDIEPIVALTLTQPEVMAALEIVPAAGGEKTIAGTGDFDELDDLGDLGALDDFDAALVAPPIDRGAEAELPAWRRFAIAVPSAGRTGPMIALVIDDMGMARQWSRRATELPGPLTLAFLPYADDLAIQTEAARRAGHELLVHVAMEPDDQSQDTGPNALFVDLEEEEIQRRLEWNLGRFGAYVGVNNHMGSRFSRDAAAMSLVLAEIEKRGLLYLDSRTTAGSLGWRLARDAGIPSAKRDVFIDNVPDAKKIARQLDLLEALALKNGYAVGVGHPRPVTLRVLAEWLPDVVARGFTLVPISAIAARRNGVDLAAAPGAADGSVVQ